MKRASCSGIKNLLVRRKKKHSFSRLFFDQRDKPVTTKNQKRNKLLTTKDQIKQTTNHQRQKRNKLVTITDSKETNSKPLKNQKANYWPVTKWLYDFWLREQKCVVFYMQYERTPQSEKDHKIYDLLKWFACFALHINNSNNT